MASAATDLLIANIVGILENEASSIAGVRDQVDEIAQELESMKAFLEDAECNASHTKVEDAWVARVRDLAYDAEDVIDEFMYRIYQQKSGGRCARWFHQTIQIPKNLWCRRQIASKLHKITTTIQAIPGRNQRYANGAAGRTSASQRGVRKWVQKSESSLLIKEDELVGIESKKQLLMGWLMKEEHSQIVVSVVGMGGSGKTTLVAKIFTNEIVKRHFNCCAWITVSQTFVIEDLFKTLIKQFYKAEDKVLPDMNAMSCRELQEILISYLESKLYLLVLDDVWDFTLWDQIRLAFPSSRSGSRIMLTTRNEEIASCSFGVESQVYRIKPLQEKEAWDLFSKKAFSTCHNKSCPPELETFAWKLVEKCKGLPLAVVALGGLMSSKKSPDQWSKVYNNLNWYLSNNPLLEDVKSILLLSFNDLPYRLKHCFLYCSLFPEDYLIRNSRLTRLWMAEGFVEHVKGVTPEEVAKEYLRELVFRSMLQEVYGEGATRCCKMHDLLLELALSISEKEKFCAVYDGRESMEDIVVRRLSIQAIDRKIKFVGTGNSQLRALLLFVGETFSLSFVETFLSRLKFLRVLDWEGAPIVKCPDQVVYLFNLRCLNLRGTQLKELPESIGRLRNLQSLDLWNTKIEALPRGIVKLLNLRQIHMCRYTNDPTIFRKLDGIKTPLKICNLKKLQFLSVIESEGNFVSLVKDMTQLTGLGISNVMGRDEKDLCISLQEMKLLTYLFLQVSNEEEFLQVDALSSPPPQLQRLILAGKLECVPRWFCSLHSLTYLYLRWTRLEVDLLPHIEALPNLEWLWLDNACAVEELCFSTGFVKLTHLELGNMPLLENITIEQGVMSNLQFLRFQRCRELKTIPEGFEYLTQLQAFSFNYASEEFCKSIEEGGVNHSKFRQRFSQYENISWELKRSHMLLLISPVLVLCQE